MYELIRSNKMIQKNLFFGVIAAIITSTAHANKEACPQAEYNMLKSMAEDEGFSWTGTLKTCTVTRTDYYQIYWANAPAGGVTQASARSGMIQFTSGGAINLVCYKISGGRWVASGKDC